MSQKSTDTATSSTPEDCVLGVRLRIRSGDHALLVSLQEELLTWVGQHSKNDHLVMEYSILELHDNSVLQSG